MNKINKSNKIYQKQINAIQKNEAMNKEMEKFPKEIENWAKI